MIIAKFKGIVLGLTVATVATTGIGVLAQSPGPPDGDRLGALERKLDRILEALGGTRGHDPLPPATADTLRETRPNISSSDSRPPFRTPANALARRSFTADRNPDIAPEAPQPPPPPALPPVPSPGPTPSAIPPALPSADPASVSTSMEGRVRALEERLDDLDRRFRELERRLSRTAPGATEPGNKARTSRTSASSDPFDPLPMDTPPTAAVSDDVRPSTVPE